MNIIVCVQKNTIDKFFQLLFCSHTFSLLHVSVDMTMLSTNLYYLICYDVVIISELHLAQG